MESFPEHLKFWRKSRRLSQLALSLLADVSSRHVSFLETGRARPSAEMILRLSQVLRVPLEGCNAMMLSAGFAPAYHGRDWSAPELASVRKSLEYMMTSHAPYPAYVVDRVWRIVDLNDPAKRLFGALGVGKGISLLDMIDAPQMRAAIENWDEFAFHAAQRLRTESAALGGVDDLERAAAKLSLEPPSTIASNTPVIPTVFKLGEVRLSLFSTVAQIGTPNDLALADLKIELFFPADEQSDAILSA